MLDNLNRIKLVDFGTSRDLQNPSMKGSGNSAHGKKIFEHFVGTPNFMPPECIRNKDSCFKSDIWSLGGLAFQFVTGFPPFIGKSEYLIFKQILEEELKFPEGLFKEDYKELIQWMMKKEINERPTVQEIKNHRFFKDFDFDNIGLFLYFLIYLYYFNFNYDVILLCFNIMFF